MNYTKGKWEVGHKGYKETPVVIVSDVVPIVIALLGQDGRIPGDEEKANAQLIASAPKLAELLGLYLADCQLEKLDYNDDTYNLAIEIGKQLGMPEALIKA